jgi:hypothetical protein
MANLALPGILEKVLYDSFVFVPPRNPIIDDFLVCLFVCLLVFATISNDSLTHR